MKTTNKTVGARYEETKDLDIAAVAKLVRKDLAAAQADGLLPAKGIKFSVRIDRYSMGESISITATWERAIRVPHATEEANRVSPIKPYPWLTRKAARVHFECEAILDRYNFRTVRENCDSDDYRFGAHVDVRSSVDGYALAEEIEQEAREAAALADMSNVIKLPVAPVAAPAALEVAETKSAQVELMETLGLV